MITGGGHHQIDLITIIIRINREDIISKQMIREEQGGNMKRRRKSWKNRDETRIIMDET